MKLRIFAAFLFLLFEITAQVKVNPTRPSAADNAFLTAYSYSEIEFGLTAQEKFYGSPALLKFTPIKHVEFGVLTSGILNVTKNGETKTETGDFGAQIKGQLVNSENYGLAILGRAEFPKDIDPRYTFYSASSIVSPQFQIDATMGASLASARGNNYKGSFIYAVALAPNLNSDFGAYAEIFGEIGDDYAPISMDVGISYSPSNSVVIDAAMFWGMNDDAQNWMFTVGVTTFVIQLFDPVERKF